MAINDTKKKLADAAMARGIQAPDSFMQAMNPQMDMEQPSGLSPMEEMVNNIKADPEFDLMAVLRLLVAEDVAASDFEDIAAELA